MYIIHIFCRAYHIITSISHAAAYLPGRSDVQCLHHWQKVLNAELIEGSWTKEVEIKYFSMFWWPTEIMHPSIFSMSLISDNDQVLFLSPFSIWSLQEDDCIIESVKEHGCRRLSFFAKSLPGRIGNQCRER